MLSYASLIRLQNTLPDFFEEWKRDFFKWCLMQVLTYTNELDLVKDSKEICIQKCKSLIKKRKAGRLKNMQRKNQAYNRL
jgi:hypothetical protein